VQQLIDPEARQWTLLFIPENWDEKPRTTRRIASWMAA
jgi:hypothetical protein